MQPDSSALDGFILYFEKLPSDDVMEARVKAYLSRERRKIKTELRAVFLDVIVLGPIVRRHLLNHITKRAKK